MKVAVVGAGAVGSLVGGLLWEAGEDVTLVGRGEHVRRINERGLHVSGAGGRRVLRPKAAHSLEESPDIVLLATKTQDLADACREVAPLVPEDAPVVTMQNGVRCDEIAREFFSPQQIVGCVVFFSASYLEPGEVRWQVRGRLIVGEPFAPGSGHLQETRELLSKALPVRISRDILASRWTKLIFNLNNALPAITGLPMQRIYFDPATSEIPLRVMREGIEVAYGAGFRLDLSPAALAMRAMVRLPEGIPGKVLGILGRTPVGREPIFGSTWQSIKRGSRTEVDYLNGEIVELGRKIGRKTPYNERVVELVHEVEKKGEFLSPEMLWPPQER
ncbi:ketopantoate reductase family protein [Rubrobacter calidifluminis]|uniref:ketopantoate reductase family protein n=1 Tax=Rubrobacter calidifluminis TaxID=1392640 RepID=UPI0023612A77|nr:2-dehydropantoate 2-reductase [Rubrobacter calidifluminis]